MAKKEKKIEKKPQPKVTVKKSKDKKQKSEKRGIRYLGGLLLAKMARGGAAELRSNAEEVNNLNVFPVPDGDTGDNMRMTIESGIAAIENLETDNLGEVMEEFSHGMLLGARGNSGVILSQFFAGIAQGLKNSEEANPETLGAALKMGVDQAYATVMTPTEGTILTVAREAVDYAVSKITPQTTIRSFFANFVKEMHASVERTPDLLPQLKEAGVVDSGGAGLYYIIDGFNRALNGQEIAADEGAEATAASKPTSVLTTGFGPDSKMTYAYCTELLVQLLNAKCDIEKFDVDALRAFLGSVGDSVVAFKTDSIVKIHVHTLTPERVLGYMREYGEFITVKIENMSVQHTDNEAAAKDAPKSESTTSAFSAKQPEAPKKVSKKHGVVAVANGAGIDSLFHELGADETIWGGQTNNPSAQDFIDAFEKIGAENIFVYPNNSNIMLAAQQAAGIYENAKIHIIPSKSIGTGYVALATMDFEAPDAETIVSQATEAIESVICGYVSPAIRDTQMNGIEIKNGDTIGIIGKEIVVAHEDKFTAALELANTLLGSERFMLTLFCGLDTTAEECALMEEKIRVANPNAEIYTIDAGQEIYPFIFVAE